MFRLYLILTFLLVLTIGAANSFASETLSCADLFSDTDHTTDYKEAKETVTQFIAQTSVKRQLFQQTKYSESMHSFVMLYSSFLDGLFEARIADTTYGKQSPNVKELGYASIYESRRIKEDTINKQIKILAIMPAHDMTSEFAADFKRMAARIYSANITKEEVLTISNRLDAILKMYGSSFYSRM